MAQQLDAARAALDRGLEHNSAGRPARASAAFRSALRRLGPAPGAAAPARDVAYVRSRSLLGLVVSEFELRADAGRAEELLDEALGWARVATAPALEVAIAGQRGLVRLRGGDIPGALEALDNAVAGIEHAEPLDACRVLLNRGSLLLGEGRLAQARADLTAVAERAERLGDRTRLFKARHNLGYLEFLAGDLPAALAAMADAADLDHDVSPAIALLDRAQVLVEAGLVTEADQILGEAASLLAAQRLAFDLAQAELARADCALLARRPHEARRWARAAHRRLLRRGNRPWAQRAELAVCQAELAVLRDEVGTPGATTAQAGGRPRPRGTSALVRLAERARELADESLDAGLARAARVTAAEAFAAAGRTQEARVLLAAAGRLTGDQPLALTVQTRLVRARLALAEGRTDRLRSEVRGGQEVLAEHRRRLGSVEAVAAAAVHGSRLVELEVGVALARGRADAVLDAVERGRATFAGAARVQPPRDERLAELLSELRQAAERRRALPPEARGPAAEELAEVRRLMSGLQRRIRERAWQVGEGVAPPRPPRAAEVRRTLRDAATEVTVLDLVVHQGAVHAVVLDAAGSRLARVADLDELRPVLRRVRADLDVLARSLPAALADVAERSLRRGLAALDDIVLRRVLGDVRGPLHVVAGGLLLTVPWGALPSRAGRATSVASRLATREGHPDRVRPPVERRDDVRVLTGPGLAASAAEARAVAECWRPPHRVEIRTGDAATSGAARAALATASVVHLAAHGRHEVDNPLFSSLRLADGPLFAHELEGLRLPRSVVVLSACEVGRSSERPGGEVLGLASVLLRLGARAVVAALAPLRDDTAAALMPALHAGLADGLAPASALAHATAQVVPPVPVSCFVDGLD
ncbi:CHAT domain-containing protein [Cellulomonas sp. APG4]|uniref:CHAT domain-containing protein n=1 Tax=Cellulomonas sp. APG4 TaxID=1538656 RepID=UPI00137AEA78|nr:CHAT domain-containing protein [Cellulomonas sp. APG4]NCT89701.1 CHAT domain-containing protein [Cellulomonas sp. APG4]